MIGVDAYFRFPSAVSHGLVLSVLLALPALRGAVPLNTAVVPSLTGSVEVDGQLDEPVWGEARTLSPFVKNGDGSPVGDKTVVRIFYDRQALYLPRHGNSRAGRATGRDEMVVGTTPDDSYAVPVKRKQAP